MTLMVDTSVWSLAFRRDAPRDQPEVHRLYQALANGEAIVSTGLLLQELLQGFVGPKAAQSIVERFSALPFLSPDRTDHIEAAGLRNLCRRHGVQIGTIDAVLAPVPAL